MSVTQLLLFIVVMVMISPAWGAKDYGLTPKEIAPGTYVLLGQNEHFNFRNGGNIVNTGFIITEKGVIVIDTGPSRLYGEQLRTAIGKITDQPIVKVFNTHLHPDHILGNQAFEDIQIAALPSTIEGIREQGELFNDSMYRLAGAWMAGTRVVLPTQIVKPGVVEMGGHRLRLFEMDGHSHADLVILDETTGVLFAADVVFHGRTPTTPHADVAHWMQALDTVSSLKFKLLVPGHGHVVSDSLPIVQTREYLQWLIDRLSQAAETGQTMAELLQSDAPSSIANLAVFREEYQRSVVHLFPDIEAKALSRGRVEQD
ncbi:MAG: quinoprotein relay system zinc metallohydrolase 1 [Candidatus Thiodiazotropha sp. (ex Lucinoma annulata)]|nr:quinoprotein relay system zinc metallohydrolase 1 [Candidatus Thiodiazotropha sp.]MCU7840009.1 quinoprotein relay system zinc metallohydrolase 1 [Candidatus Thiodiazotropha sp. (ex Troendleina suluensis)]MCU7871670.1 quinoprotein relay system zinc metallohydrolase 1 [Candidatus Thiodiazotropha sp. (ex Lucinoma borealis)]MCU7884421.1 quinoprotein relay system zinc metallohydrolase 1 [Candidatus Thiodiazotropha sp. (ex Lucinoma annulata)]